MQEDNNILFIFPMINPGPSNIKIEKNHCISSHNSLPFCDITLHSQYFLFNNSEYI